MEVHPGHFLCLGSWCPQTQTEISTSFFRTEFSAWKTHCLQSLYVLRLMICNVCMMLWTWIWFIFLHQALSVPFKCRLTFEAKRKNVNWVALPVGNEGSWNHTRLWWGWNFPYSLLNQEFQPKNWHRQIHPQATFSKPVGLQVGLIVILTLRIHGTGIFTYICLKFRVNIHTIHGSYGLLKGLIFSGWQQWWQPLPLHSPFENLMEILAYSGYNLI